MTRLPIVDSHVHLWDPERFRIPWIDADARLHRRYELPEFVADSAGLAVEAIVYVEVNVTPAYALLEARWAAVQAERDPRLAGVVAWAPIADGTVVRTYLDELVRISPRIRGVRQLLQGQPPGFATQPEFLRGLRLLPSYGLSFDICITHDQLPEAIDMVRACPETKFILDHLGKPDVRGGRLDPWRDHIIELANLRNVLGCKLSGLVTEADHERWTVQDLQPYVRHTLEVFGEERVMFGGDWPVVRQASSYARWVGALAELTRSLTDSAQRKLWADNARCIYRL